MQPGKTLALLGGDVRMEGGNLQAPGGRVELGGLRGTGTVGLSVNGSDMLLSFPVRLPRADVSLDNGADVNVSAGGGGSIAINTQNLNLARESKLQAGIASGLGLVDSKAGDIEINASGAIKLTDGSFISNAVTSGAVGKGGGINVTAGSLSLTNGAVLGASTFGRGDAGSISVNASGPVTFDGVNSNGSESRAISDVYDTAEGNGGNINVTAGSLSLTSGAQLAARTFNQGDAGSVTITARDAVSVDGVGRSGPSGVIINVEGGAEGNGGDINVTAESLSLTNGGVLSASSEGNGAAGNIEVAARSIRLDNQGKLTAQTASGQGGNITLQAQDLLLLRRNSQISTTAGTTQAGGDGGNITINAPFIIAVPSENSDITANAFTGRGGRIQVNAQGIFGTQSRPLLTPESDITASSTFGVSGEVDINTPDVDPSQGLVNLPTQPIETEVVQACQPGGSEQQSEFIITGRGGLPPNPTDFLNTDAVWIDLDSTTQQAENRPRKEEATQQTFPTPGQLVEATGWVLNDKGEVVLIASAPTATPHSPGLTTANCH